MRTPLCSGPVGTVLLQGTLLGLILSPGLAGKQLPHSIPLRLFGTLLSSCLFLTHAAGHSVPIVAGFSKLGQCFLPNDALLVFEGHFGGLFFMPPALKNPVLSILSGCWHREALLCSYRVNDFLAPLSCSSHSGLFAALVRRSRLCGCSPI